MTIAGGAVFYDPPPHNRAKYHQPHRSGGHTYIQDAGNQERALVNSPPEKSARRTTGNQTLLEGEDQINRHVWRGSKGKKREETGDMHWARNPGESWNG